MVQATWHFFAIGQGRWLNRPMLEQPEMAENHGVAIVSLKLRALPGDARCWLAAVRVAQESAQRRARQQTIHARIWLALLVGAVALGAVTLRPRVAAWRRSRAETAKPTSTSPRTVPMVREPGPSALSAAAPVTPRAKANDTGVPAEGCDTSTRSGLWRRSSAACARAFAADPKNASLALAVARAEHAHAHLDEAAQWARRALALDPTPWRLYVIIARADAEHGRDGDARTAYQRYLEIAPRGWHKSGRRGRAGPARPLSPVTAPAVGVIRHACGRPQPGSPLRNARSPRNGRRLRRSGARVCRLRLDVDERCPAQGARVARPRALPRVRGCVSSVFGGAGQPCRKRRRRPRHLPISGHAGGDCAGFRRRARIARDLSTAFSIGPAAGMTSS